MLFLPLDEFDCFQRYPSPEFICVESLLSLVSSEEICNLQTVDNVHIELQLRFENSKIVKINTPGPLRLKQVLNPQKGISFWTIIGVGIREGYKLALRG